MRVIKLTDNQYALLQAFIEKAAGYDSVQDALGEAAEAALGHNEPSSVQECEDQADAEIKLQNEMWAAIDNAEEIPE